MSLIDWADLVCGNNFAFGSYGNFQPGFRDDKANNPVDEFRRENLRNKAKMAKNKNYDFCAYHSFGNSQSCITVVKWDAYDVKNTAGINGKTIPSGPQISSRFHPGNRAEVLIGQKC